MGELRDSHSVTVNQLSVFEERWGKLSYLNALHNTHKFPVSCLKFLIVFLKVTGNLG